MKRVIIAALIIAVDQLLKFLAVKSLLPLWGGFFGSVVCNQNIAWGLPVHGELLTFIWAVCALAFAFLLVKTNWNLLLLVAFSGAISNIIDRAHLGCVLDFIKIGSFPIFNIADICITLGIVLFLITKPLKKESGTKNQEL